MIRALEYALWLDRKRRAINALVKKSMKSNNIVEAFTLQHCAHLIASEPYKQSKGEEINIKVKDKSIARAWSTTFHNILSIDNESHFQ